MDISNLDFRHYGLGNARSLHDYELYCGVDFQNRRVHKYASRINDSTSIPEPYIMSEEEWSGGMLSNNDFNIKWDYADIPDNKEFDFWFFGFEDKEDKLLWRKDFNHDDKYYLAFFNKERNEHRTVFGCEGTVDHCVIIPHIKNEGWAKKLIIKV
jgi:hypothetical protein